MIRTIDINSDLGEGFGVYRMADDEWIMSKITSVNIACGFHAGDPMIMDQTVQLAKKYGVKVGAHPSYPDMQGFGRRYVEMSYDELVCTMIYQIGALQAFCHKHDVLLHHVKPHGSLSHQTDVDEQTALALLEAVQIIDKTLILYVKPSTVIHRLVMQHQIPHALEIYADRAYHHDLTLVSRALAGSLLTDPSYVSQRVLHMLEHGNIKTYENHIVDIQGDTLCVHGDTPGAIAILQEIHQTLHKAGIQIQPYV